MKEQDKKSISLPADLYGKVEQRVKTTDFGSVDEYVEFVLGEVVKEEEEEKEKEKEKAFSEEEEKEVKKRLKDLGYLG